MKYNIILNMGYTSSTRIAYVPFYCFNEFRSAQEAVTDLAKFFKEQYDKRHVERRNKCCVSYKEKGDAFCAKCGTQLVADKFRVDRFQEYLNDIAGLDLDSYGDFLDDETQSSDHRWEPSGNHSIPLGESYPHFKHVMVYHAENVIPAAIGHSPDSRVTAKKIFKNPNDSTYCFW